MEYWPVPPQKEIQILEQHSTNIFAQSSLKTSTQLPVLDYLALLIWFRLPKLLSTIALKNFREININAIIPEGLPVLYFINTSPSNIFSYSKIPYVFIETYIQNYKIYLYTKHIQTYLREQEGYTTVATHPISNKPTPRSCIITSTSMFIAGDYVHLFEGDVYLEIRRISHIPNATTLEFINLIDPRATVLALAANSTAPPPTIPTLSVQVHFRGITQGIQPIQSQYDNTLLQLSVAVSGTVKVILPSNQIPTYHHGDQIYCHMYPEINKIHCLEYNNQKRGIYIGVAIQRWNIRQGYDHLLLLLTPRGGITHHTIQL